MTLESSIPRSRRALLAASLGVAGASLLAASRPLVTRAVDTDPVLVGGSHTGTNTTTITTTSNPAIAGVSDVQAGVRGASTSNHGVRGTSTSGLGVYGYCASSVGVFGLSGALSAPGIVGKSDSNNTGVLGFSGSAGEAYPSSPSRTGVYGYAAQDATANGVTGQTTAGRGVNGVATTGRGVNGVATSGQGVRGQATTGVAGYFATSTSAGTHTGTALVADGRVKFPNCAGMTLVESGNVSATVTPGIDLASTSAVVATIQGNPAGTAVVRSVAVNTTDNTFRVYLTGPAAVDLKVAWHVFG